MENPFNTVVDLDRLKIKEERTIRNEIKNTAKKVERKQQQEQKESQYKISTIGGNINLITKDLAEILTKKQSVYNSKDIQNDEVNFPALGNCSRIPKRDTGDVNLCIIPNDSRSDKQGLSLGDFLNKPTKVVVPTKTKCEINFKYAGNSLDSDAPVRKKGKFREVPKPKRGTALKREIIKEQSECVPNPDSLKLCLTDVFPDVVINEEIDEAITAYISRVVELQEKLFKRDCIKGKYKRRYVVGFHEAKKYLNLNKVKIIVIATDIKFTKPNDAMSRLLEDIIQLCKKNEIMCLFALKRRKIGTLTLKYIPVSCIAILNHEGAEAQLQDVKLMLSSINNSAASIKDSG